MSLVQSISGAVIRAELDQPVMLGEVMLVGHERLLGEVVELDKRAATLQVYEETGGLAAGSPVFGAADTEIPRGSSSMGRRGEATGAGGSGTRARSCSSSGGAGGSSDAARIRDLPVR